MAKILIVDDEESIRETLGRFLRSQGYEVRFAKNGLEGLEAIRAGTPDLVVTDVRMPTMTGLELCAVLKKNPQTAGIPVVFVTALDTMGDMENALAQGGQGYITKPFEFPRVLSKVQSLLK